MAQTARSRRLGGAREARAALGLPTVSPGPGVVQSAALLAGLLAGRPCAGVLSSLTREPPRFTSDWANPTERKQCFLVLRFGLVCRAGRLPAHGSMFWESWFGVTDLRSAHAQWSPKKCDSNWERWCHSHELPTSAEQLLGSARPAGGSACGWSQQPLGALAAYPHRPPRSKIGGADCGRVRHRWTALARLAQLGPSVRLVAHAWARHAGAEEDPSARPPPFSGSPARHTTCALWSRHART